MCVCKCENLPWDHFSCILLKLEFWAIFKYTYFCARRKTCRYTFNNLLGAKKINFSHHIFDTNYYCCRYCCLVSCEAIELFIAKGDVWSKAITIIKLSSDSLHCWTFIRTSGVSSLFQMFLILSFTDYRIPLNP